MNSKYRWVHLKNTVPEAKKSIKPGNVEAKFFLIVIQIVAEAARFKFIETIVRNDNTPNF